MRWLTLLALLVVASPRGAWAASLDQVRVFAGTGHARVLLVTDGLPTGLQTRSSPPVGAIPARGIVVLEQTSPGEEGARTIPVDTGGIRQIQVSVLGEHVQVTIEMDDARVVRAEALGQDAVLVDLVGQGREEDPSLPTRDQLLAWVEGVSLVRAAGGPPRQRHLVVIDPGHGGKDNGAVGADGTREADIALQIALRAARGLRENLGIDVIMTRETDEFLTLGARAALANKHDADLFLSIHCNASPRDVAEYAFGIETYSLDTASGEGAARVAARENAILREQAEDEGAPDPLLANLLVSGTNRLSRDLAHHVQASVIAHLTSVYGEDNVKDLGTKTALFYVLVSTRMPAILFEANFITNETEERRLRSPHYQQAIADAIVEAVGAWLERQDTAEEGDYADAPYDDGPR